MDTFVLANDVCVCSKESADIFKFVAKNYWQRRGLCYLFERSVQPIPSFPRSTMINGILSFNIHSLGTHSETDVELAKLSSMSSLRGIWKMSDASSSCSWPAVSATIILGYLAISVSFCRVFPDTYRSIRHEDPILHYYVVSCNWFTMIYIWRSAE